MTREGTPMHDIERLINVDNPTWPHLQKLIFDE